jgi:hypothetical protein
MFQLLTEAEKVEDYFEEDNSISMARWSSQAWYSQIKTLWREPKMCCESDEHWYCEMLQAFEYTQRKI